MKALPTSTMNRQPIMNKNNLNILIVAGIFPPDIGGPATYVPKIASELVKWGCEVTVITMSDELNHDDSGYPFKVIRRWRGQFKPIRFLQTVLTIIKHGRRSDLIFANELGVESAVANLFLGKPLVRKIVGDWAWEKGRNEGLVEDELEEFQRKRYSFRIETYRRLQNFFTRRAHRIITPSYYLKNIVAGWGIPAWKIEVIYNALERKFSNFSSKEAARNMIGVSPPLVVTVGRLITLKCVDRLIRTIAEIEGVNLIVVGDGPERSKLEELADAVAKGRVQFTGHVSHENVFKYLQAADVFVLNSIHETMPHVILEAISMQTPVVATRVGGIPEIVDDGITGLLVESKNDAQLQTSISRLLKEPSMRDMLVKNAKSELKRRFSLGVMVDETLKLFHQSVPFPLLTTHHSPLTTAVLFVGGTRYSYPLGEMHKKKFRALADVSENYVFAYSTDNRFRTFFDGAHFYLIPSKMPRLFRYPFFLSLALGTIIYTVFKHNVKVIICQTPYEGISGAVAKLLLKMLRKPISLVTELHGDWEKTPSWYLNPRLKFMSCIYDALGKFVSGVVIRYSDVIRTISDFLTAKLPQALRKPTIKFPTYTNIELFLKEEDARIYPNYPYNGYILYVGMLIYLKGIHVLIKSMSKVVKQYPEQKLLIAGDGEYRGELEKLVRAIKLEDNIVFLGHIDQKILREYLQNCLVMVLPSFTEGLGRVIAEAMACGKPVIATKVGGIPELIRDGENGFLIQPNDSEGLADKIIYFIQNPSVAYEMGEKGKKFVQEILSTEKYVCNFQKMVQMALECI